MTVDQWLPTIKLEGRVEYRTGGLDFQSAPMHLENTNYSHLQRSIDSLRSISDRLGERNIDLRLNLHNDLRSDRNGLGQDRLNPANSLSLNRTFNDRDFLQTRPQDRNLSFDRIMSERSLNDHRSINERMNFDRSVSAERLSLERTLVAQNANRGLTDRNNLNSNTGVMNASDRNGAERLRSGLDMRDMNSDGRQNNMNEMKFRDYKAHLDSLRNMESSRSIEGKNDEERGTPSSPSTPLSVGEGFPEEKVFSTVFIQFSPVRLDSVVDALRKSSILSSLLHSPLCVCFHRGFFIEIHENFILKFFIRYFHNLIIVIRKAIFLTKNLTFILSSKHHFFNKK